jgi:CRP-like cAMP-binding protein
MKTNSVNYDVILDKEPVLKFIDAILSASNIKISREQFETILSFYEPKTLRKNEFFVTEGKVNGESFFMTEGFMRAFIHDISGQEVTTYFYSKNRPVFEPASFYTRTKATENIQAITPCEGFILSFEGMNKLFHNVPEFREFGRTMLVREFLAFKKRALSLINKTAEERYEELIGTNREIFQFAQLRYIASYLGITDSSLSRIRKEFAKK